MAVAPRWALEVEGLSKRFGSTHVLRDVSIRVPAGSCYGFLGLNGAGKTTTIRTILGLERPDRGRWTMVGASCPDSLGDALPRVGALLEGQRFFPHLSARRNLEVMTTIAGHHAEPAELDELLGRVGLADATGKVRTFSHGMTRRLGLAAALIGSPQLLVLDEPGVGMDPDGVRLFRSLIGGLKERGVSIFLSSHLLAEVQRSCDVVGVIAGGSMVFEGPIDELLPDGPTTSAGELEDVFFRLVER